MPRLGVAIVLAAALLGAAGCGSSDDGTTNTADAPAVSPAPDGTPTDATPTETPAATDSAPSTTPAATTSSGGVSTDGVGDGSPGSSSGGASTDGVAACTSGVLAASLDFTGGGAAGSTTGNLVLRNTSNAACTLSGYPGVSFVGDSGNQLGVPAARSGAAARTITIHAGDSAFASLKITDALNYSSGTCGPVDATGLRIYPPGEKAALFVNHAVKACSKSVQLLTVGPMSTD